MKSFKSYKRPANTVLVPLYKKGAKMKKMTILIWIIAGLLFSFSMGYITGENAGRRAGILRATDDISYCYENGASGYYTTKSGVRCLYD